MLREDRPRLIALSLALLVFLGLWGVLPSQDHNHYATGGLWCPQGVSPRSGFAQTHSSSTPWPMFRANAQHTGVSSYSTADNPYLVRWKLNFPSSILTHIIIGPGDILYTTSLNCLYAIYPNGSIKWVFTPPYPEDFFGCPAVDDNGTIYVGSQRVSSNWQGGGLYALYPNGTIKWAYYPGENEKQSRVFSSPTIGPDNTIYIMDSNTTHHGVSAIYPNGTLKWAISSFQRSSIAPPPSLDRYGRIYSWGDPFLIIHPNGTVYKKINTEALGSAHSVSLGPDGTIYLTLDCDQGPGRNHCFAAMDIDGILEWVYYWEGGSHPIITKDLIYASSIDILTYRWTLHAFLPNGSIKWSLPDVGIPAAMDSDHLLYTLRAQDSPSGLPDVWVIWPNGTIKERIFLNIPKSQKGASLAIGSDGTLYILTSDFTYNSTLYAVGKTPPSPPTDIAVVEGDSFLNLSWAPPRSDGGSPLLRYNVYCGPSKDNLSLIDSVPHSQTYYNLSDLLNGRRYFLTVTALNALGESVPGDILEATPHRVPDPPQNLSVLSGDSYIILSWDPPPFNGGKSLISYRIYRRTSTTSFEVIKFLSSSSRQYNDTSVRNGINYYYYVTAVNPAGESPPSNIASATPCTLPTPPSISSLRLVTVM